MTIEQIRKAHQAQPFRPFTLRTGGGREYEIPHPELLAIIPPGRTIVVACADGTAELLDLLLVESLHFHNGRRRGRRPGMS
ncbi:MAG: hypothetical protein AB1716_21050 [Planctomycetota bacterium]